MGRGGPGDRGPETGRAGDGGGADPLLQGTDRPIQGAEVYRFYPCIAQNRIGKDREEKTAGSVLAGGREKDPIGETLPEICARNLLTSKTVLRNVRLHEIRFCPSCGSTR